MTESNQEATKTILAEKLKPLKMKIKTNLNHYLIRAEELNIIPNFFTSLPYLMFSNSECFKNENWIWIETDSWCLFPPLSIGNSNIFPVERIWCTFEDWELPNNFKKEFLDWEYIFDPTHFNQMKGGKWNVYRKNVRKWFKRQANWIYCSRFDYKEAKNILLEWLSKKSDEIQDSEIISKFVLWDNPYIHKKCLYDANEKLVAINIWDENWKYINFRFCIVKSGEYYLDEFVRWLFYTDIEIQSKNKLVNDGGSLGIEGLEKFKDKMNPLIKNSKYSLIL